MSRALREALEFYADPFAWKAKHDLEDVVRIPDFYSETSFGDRAAEALELPEAEIQSAGHGWRSPMVTVADLINNLLTLDQSMPVFGLYFIERDGKKEARARGLTLSREHVAEGRIKRDASVPYSLAIWSAQDERPDSPSEANSTAAPVKHDINCGSCGKMFRDFAPEGAPTCDCGERAVRAMKEEMMRPAPVDAGVREAGVDWPVYGDGEAPWSEDEQFDEQRKACKARTKQFGECGGEGDYEGQCDDCGYDAQDALRKKYRPALASSQPVVGVDQK